MTKDDAICRCWRAADNCGFGDRQDLGPLSPQKNTVQKWPPPRRWFTRCWTLQELVAPPHVQFYDMNWNFRGDKLVPRVLQHLERITDIDAAVLRDGSERNLRKVCLGRRMSWAAFRRASRKEDVAYSLMGIFQVNMPMLYGEGDRAFFRLQEEIIKYSTDFSIFAWRQRSSDTRKHRGILSCHPDEFQDMGDCTRIRHMLSQLEEPEAVITSKGLRIEATSIIMSKPLGQLDPCYEHMMNARPTIVSERFLHLGCAIGGRSVFIKLQLLNGTTFVRSMPDTIFYLTQYRRSKDQALYMVLDYDDQDADDNPTSLLLRCLQSNMTVTNTKAGWPGLRYYYRFVETRPLDLVIADEDTSFVRKLPNMFGTIKLWVGRSESSDPEKSFKANLHVVEFILVLYRQPSTDALSCFIVESKQILNFEKFIDSLWGLGPSTAEQEFFSYCDSAGLIPETSGQEASLNFDDMETGIKLCARIEIKPTTSGNEVSQSGEEGELYFNLF